MTWILAGLALCSANVQAVTMGSSTNRYGAIPQRNVFGLKEAPEPTVQPQAARPLPKLILTGITTILGYKQVFLKELPTAGGPAAAGKEKPLTLTEGQRDGDIEVLQIDEKADSVRVINSGTPMLLTFEKDGAKLPTSPAPGTVPSPVPGAQPAPAAAAGGTPAPNAASAAAATPPVPPTGTPAAQPGFHVLPSRTPRLPATGAATGAGPTAPASSSTTPTPTAQTSTPAAAPVAAPAQADLTPEQQLLLQELQRELTPSSPAAPGTTGPLKPQ